MSKFYGMIGYADTVETVPGVWTETIIERPYYGDITKNVSRWESSQHLNDNINISNIVSIVADPYAYNNFHKIRYVQLFDALWEVSSIEVEQPRLKLTIGGIYNGTTPETSSDSEVD